MTLKIEISNISSSEAVDFISACRNVQDDMNEAIAIKTGENPASFELVAMQFEYKEDPQPIFKGESTPFERYINSTRKE